MSLQKPFHIAAFVLTLGTLSYLASALWSAIFIVPLPMAPDAVVDVLETEGPNGQLEYRPIEFKNRLEELKYFHNVRMKERNGYWVWGQIIIGLGIGAFCFYYLPKWRSIVPERADHAGIGIGAAFLGLGTTLIFPMILSFLLPAPYKWFPQEIVDIADLREAAELERLITIAEGYDNWVNQVD
ncbi:hypothetical protein Enr13x_07180 [Stieleria neptunia]|uniref:Uncharacterized protein n=1 Tax=Stieleria neptunia TaxID=2527979 RepID=A0A518HJ74_9BACT|nr:hypothetical protein [Stieleria neptunia]QDV40882.1 hypothetical protein Enr13x_07180 [Stieleria neptunia]